MSDESEAAAWAKAQGVDPFGESAEAELRELGVIE